MAKRRETLLADWNSLPVRIYYEDTDSQGIVYFANYQRFMERGRTEWLRDHHVSQEFLRKEHQLLFSLTNTSVKYHKPALLDQLVYVMTRVDELRGARITFLQEVRLEATDGELLASAKSVAACIDALSLRPRRLSVELKHLLSV